MHKWIALLAVAALLFSGCASTTEDPDAGEEVPDDGLTDITRVQDRADLPFVTDHERWSQTLERGPFGILDGIGQVITVEMPIGSGLPSAEVHMGLFFPEIEGCDWPESMSVGVDPALAPVVTATPDLSLDDKCRLPVVADIGPYYGEPVLGDVHANDPANRLGAFLIENLVPHGYIVAQVSVTGTGDSTGCMDLMGPVEQAGVQAAVRFLGDSAWSNGNVGLIGRSYDGSTPWEAAMAEDLPQLKTVVPISGLYGQYDLMWKNGSAELRGPGVLWGLYYAFTYTGNDPVSTGGDSDAALLQARQIAENLVCPETQTGGAYAAGTYLFGQGPAELALEEGTYWELRSFRAEVLQNYDGSVYFIHGMQDWNVDPHMAFPFYQELEDKGLEMKGLFGQWGHMYPDRVSEHPSNLRWDWAQDLLEWFDHYLKGTGDQPQLHVEIEDDRNQWRIEETWPPADLQWQVHTVPGHPSNSAGNCQTVADQATIQEGCTRVYDLGVQDDDNDTRYAGLAKFHVDVTPTGPGGQLYAELRDATDDKRLTHAIMDLRYHQGGTDMQTVVPGQTITALMEFFPADMVLPAGHKLEVRVSATGQDYLNSAVSSPVIVESFDLKLPIIDRDGSTYFTPPGWEDTETVSTTARLS